MQQQHPGPIAALVLALSALAVPACAQDQPDLQQQQLDMLQQQIQSSKATEARIAAEIAAAIREQDSVSEKLAAIARSIKSQEAVIAESEAQLRSLSRQRAEILASLGERQDQLSQLLAGLQRLQENPPPALVVEPDDVLAALRGAMLLGTLVPELKGEADRLAAQLDQLKQIEATINERKATVAGDLERLHAARQDLAALVSRKKELVNRSSAELEAERRRIAALGEKASSLKQLLAAIAAERRRTEAAAAARLEAEARERRRQEELLRRPKLAFADARGKLEFPAQGQIVRRFGDPDGLGGAAQGVMIATAAGAQVTTPADGQVEFAGPFRSYGDVVIINPGGGYRLLLAGMDKVAVGVGDFLRAGEPVGEMGEGPASVTLFGEVVQDGRPVLYIEFRNSTEAIDSGPWWIGGLKEARG
jgi:septal ring factor EnvC (AmiA/AmiB activator)